MRLIIPLIFIAFASTVQAQDVIEWSDKRKLTFADFKKAPDLNHSAEMIISRYGIVAEIDSAKLPLIRSFNQEVTAVFYPDEAWIATTNKTALQYSNTVFDIYEWACREFRKRLMEKRDLLLAGKVEDIANELNTEFVTILEAYDSESQYGSNLLEQMKWESRISQNLYALGAYCKTCGEPKVN